MIEYLVQEILKCHARTYLNNCRGLSLVYAHIKININVCTPCKKMSISSFPVQFNTVYSSMNCTIRKQCFDAMTEICYSSHKITDACFYPFIQKTHVKLIHRHRHKTKKRFVPKGKLGFVFDEIVPKWLFLNLLNRRKTGGSTVSDFENPCSVA